MSQVITIDYLLTCVDRLQEAASIVRQQYSHINTKQQFEAEILLTHAAASVRGAASELDQIQTNDKVFDQTQTLSSDVSFTSHRVDDLNDKIERLLSAGDRLAQSYRRLCIAHGYLSYNGTDNTLIAWKEACRD